MIDKKIYRTDYESEITGFFKELSSADEPESAGVTYEVSKYSKIGELRDNAGNTDSRDKLWEGF